MAEAGNTLFGTLEQFQPGPTASFTRYVERVRIYLRANGVDDADRQRDIFLTVIGPACYDRLVDLLQPRSPAEVSFDDLITVLTSYYDPKPSKRVQRYYFYNRVQAPEESIAAYIAELRRLAEHCEFGTQLEEMLCDRLVVGVRDDNLRRKLLTQTDTGFQKAQELAIAHETAVRDASMVNTGREVPTVAAEVHLLGNRPSQRVDRRAGTPQQQPPPPRAAAQCCASCGGAHLRVNCRFRSAVCRLCRKMGHISTVCRSRPTGRPAEVTGQQQRAEPAGMTHMVSGSDYSVFALSGNGVHSRKGQVDDMGSCPPIIVPINVDGKSTQMHVDTGADFSCITLSSFDDLWPQPKGAPQLHPFSKNLKAYTGQQVPIVGKINVKASLAGRSAVLPLLVVHSSGPNLLGRNWIRALRYSVPQLQALAVSESSDYADADLSQLKAEFPSLFAPGLGKFTGPPVNIPIQDNAQPVFKKARAVPLALRERVEQELKKLVDQDILEPVRFSRWATPIVAVSKANGDLRLCGDYKVTVNRVAKAESYPLPRFEDLLAALPRASHFSKLDLSQAYQQLVVDDPTQELLTINTHRGLFKVKRLAFGISSAPGLFQRVMETILQGLPGVVVFLDDILIADSTKKEHDARLRMVLSRLQLAGLRLRADKCAICKTQVVFLGHLLSANGIQPLADKVAAIQDVPTPKSTTDVKVFLGMLQYYGRFLPGLATVVEPLHRLLDKGHQWAWTPQCDQAFHKAKALLSSQSVLVHFDPELPTILSVDASPYGLGAVLAHQMPDGSERPVAFASRTLAVAERRYAQVDREALAVVFGTKKFHMYLFGRHFTIVTDHKPVLGLLNATRATPAVCSPRVLRWSVDLGGYDYELIYRPGSSIPHADALSRLPLPVQPKVVPGVSDILLLQSDCNLQLSSKKIADLSRNDPVISKVMHWAMQGWPTHVDSSFECFARRQAELTVESGCLVWGARLVIPPKARKAVLDLLHDAHQGISATKSKARAYVWWPNMDQEIEQMCKSCQCCGLQQHQPKSAPSSAWPVPEKPWSRLHLDHAGPFQGHIFLLVVDAYSRWLEVVSVASTSSDCAIQKLRILFATHGLPDLLVSDNAAAFTSDAFQQFCAKNGIRHVTAAPGHPSTNGLVERAVQTFKQSLQKIVRGDWTARLARFLLQQHSTPHTSTGVSPAELLMRRRIKTHLACLRPDFVGRCQIKQDVALSSREARATGIRVIKVGDFVWATTFCNSPKWFLAVVSSVVGPRSFLVKSLSSGKLYKRHLDHLVQTECTTSGEVDDARPLPDEVLPSFSESLQPSWSTGSTTEPVLGVDVALSPEQMQPPDTEAVTSPPVTSETSTPTQLTPADSDTVPPSATSSDICVPLRRSGRAVKPVDRLNL